VGKWQNPLVFFLLHRLFRDRSIGGDSIEEALPSACRRRVLRDTKTDHRCVTGELCQLIAAQGALRQVLANRCGFSLRESLQGV
jgi:hypothetical protein